MPHAVALPPRLAALFGESVVTDADLAGDAVDDRVDPRPAIQLRLRDAERAT
jgi:hypothetical protein